MSTKDINMRWKTNFKLDIPKFHGGLSSDLLLDWLVQVEKNLEFQSVSDDQFVSFVVKKFRGQAASWWQQVKTTRKRDGKNPIKSWGKLKQKLCATFLPHHSHSLVYNRLQDLKQPKRFVDYKESYRFQGNGIVHKPDHGIYRDDSDLKKGERFVYGFAENCQFQENDFVGEHGHVHDSYEHLDQIHDKDGDVLDLDVYNEDDADGGKGSLTFNDKRPHEVERELYGPSLFDIYDDEDPPYDIHNDDDGGRFVEDKTETELVSAVVHTSCDFVLKQSCDLCYANNLEDDVKDDFDREEEHGVGVVDIEGYDDDLDNTNDTNKDDNYFVNQINELIYDYGEDDIDFIGHQRMEYRRLSQNKHDLVITSLDMEAEVSYIGKRNHNYYIFLAHHYHKIKTEPPDRGRYKIMFSHSEIDLYHKIYGTLVSHHIRDKDNPSLDDFYREEGKIIDFKVIKYAEPLVFVRHCRLTREHLHVSYKTNQKNGRIYVCSSKMEFLNWAFGQETPMKFQFCGKRVVYDEDVDVINPTNFFLANGAAVDKNKWHIVDFCVEDSIMMMFFSGEIEDVSYAVTNTMDFLLGVYEAIATKTCEESGIYLLLFDVREEAQSGRSSIIDDIMHCRDLALATSPLINHQYKVEVEGSKNIFMNREKYKIKVKNYVLMRISMSSVGVSMSLGKMEILNLSNDSCFVSGALRLVLQLDSFLTYVFVGWEASTFLWPMWDILSFMASTRRREIVPIKHLRFPINYIDVTTCLGWKDNELNYKENDTGQPFQDQPRNTKSHLLFVVSSFSIVLLVGDMSKVRMLHHRQHFVNGESVTCGVSTWVKTRFVVGRKTINAVDVVLMWKLLVSSLEMHSTFHSRTKRALGNTLRCLLQAQFHLNYLASQYTAAHVRRRDLLFEPGHFLWMVFSKDRLCFHEYQQALTFSPQQQDKRIKENEDLVVTHVQGSLEATIVLTKALYGRSFSKLLLRRKKERYDVRKRQYYELVDKGYLQRSKIRVESF